MLIPMEKAERRAHAMVRVPMYGGGEMLFFYRRQWAGSRYLCLFAQALVLPGRVDPWAMTKRRCGRDPYPGVSRMIFADRAGAIRPH